MLHCSELAMGDLLIYFYHFLNLGMLMHTIKRERNKSIYLASKQLTICDQHHFQLLRNYLYSVKSNIISSREIILLNLNDLNHLKLISHVKSKLWWGVLLLCLFQQMASTVILGIDIGRPVGRQGERMQDYMRGFYGPSLEISYITCICIPMSNSVLAPELMQRG